MQQTQRQAHTATAACLLTTAQTHMSEKRAPSTNGAKEAEYPHTEEWDEIFSLASYGNQFRLDQRGEQRETTSRRGAVKDFLVRTPIAQGTIARVDRSFCAQ